MNDNQILVVHSRWVYNFMGIILEAQVYFSLLCIIFQIQFQILVIFKPYVYVRRDRHRESTCLIDEKSNSLRAK